MEIEIDLNKTVEENATKYFEKSKTARKKILGLKKAIIITKEIAKKKIPVKKKETKKKKWFEKYRWFFTSDGLLVVGGKTAVQNEEIVKKRMDKRDVYFHAEVYGAPHCVVKISESKLKSVPEQSMKEAAQFAASFSKAFETGQSSADAYSVKPDQVSKRAPSGTSLATGAFMIYGERNWFKKTTLSCGIGYLQKEKILMCGPYSAIKRKAIHVFELKYGTVEKNKTAKALQDKYKEKGLIFTNEEILSLLPNGKFEIV
jgi:predicted ribosome quality control (RQC) complex YloA/Tae2 family protein